MKTKRILSAVIVCILLFSLAGTAMAADFTDVDSGHEYYDEILFCQSKNYISGTSATMFEPDASLTRGQLAVILCRAELLQAIPIDVTKGNFTDIASLNNYYDAAAIIMGCLGVVTGTSEMTFSPNTPVTREQLAAVIMRLLHLGADNEDAYQVYNDYETISDYATIAVSACLNADVFIGLFNGENFMPKNAVTRAEICKLIYTVSQPAHTITIAPMTGGTVTPSQTTAKAGKVIMLTVTPEDGKQLVAGSLMYNETAITGTSFVMPDMDVTVTAMFEDVPLVLQSIAVTTMPTKTAYIVDETLDLTGMVVTATYTNETTAVVTVDTTDPADGAALGTAGTIPVTVSYTEGTVTETATFNVEVTAT